MTDYIAEVGARATVQVTLVGEYEYTTSFGWKSQTIHIYTMKDSEGRVLVWKTSALLGIDVQDDTELWWYGIRKGDCFEIKATVKAHGEYKGQKQTEVQRLKVTKVIEKAPTKEEIEEKKKEEQIASLSEGDFIWRMPYRQFKDHYSDCETVTGSFIGRDDPRSEGVASISVIIRAGRLKASGVRGEHYSGYVLEDEKGSKMVYRAVCEDNAIKRAKKEFPNHNWKCTKVYSYN